MKSLFATVLMLVTLFCLAVSPAGAVPRVVLTEGFTQWNCGYCAPWNPVELGVVEEMGWDTVVNIKWHVWWPGANNDPFYLWNSSEAGDRTRYYGVQNIGVPHGYVDGRTVITQSQVGFRNQIRSRRNTPAPCSIDLLACSETATAVDFSGVITASDSALTNTQLFVVLLSNYEDTSGGTNGETEFYNIFRDMWPNVNGQTFSVAQGGTYEFTGSLNKDAGWDPLNLSVVVFIQDYSTKWVHQAGAFPVRPMWGMETVTEDPRQVPITTLDQLDFLVELSNTSCNNDVYTVSLTGHVQDGWTRTIESPGIPASPTSIQIPLNVGESAWLQMRVNPNGHRGMMNTDIVVSSQGNPSVQVIENFRVLTEVSVLVVDDDGGETYGNVDPFYIDPVVNAIPGGQSFAIYDLELGSMSDELLMTPNLVIWFAGANAPGRSLSFTDQSMLIDYLERGGNLLLTGQNIPYDLRTSSFMPQYLHSRFSFVYLQASTVTGVAGDPISGGLDFTIHGGTGADNQTRPSAITSEDEMSTVIWEYSGSEYHAGVRVETSAYRAVLMGFGLESIDNQADRDTVLARSVNWLLANVSADPETPAVQHEYALSAAYPNPFNPVTVIPYSLAERSDVSLRIFDVLGREVAVLASGVQNAGLHHLEWNANGVPSGVYFARLEAAAGTKIYRATQKLMLLK